MHHEAIHQVTGSSDLARGFSASDLSCTSDVRMLTCESIESLSPPELPRPLSKNCTFDLSTSAVTDVASLLAHPQPHSWICMCELVSSLLDLPNGFCLSLHHHRDEFALGTVSASMQWLHGGQCQGTFLGSSAGGPLSLHTDTSTTCRCFAHLGYTCDDLHLLNHRLLVLHHNEHVDNLELFLRILHDLWTVCTASSVA